MQHFNCPFCGLRDQSEFTYGREKAAIPALAADRDAWQRYVYDRENPAGPHAEWWHHNHGCRQWLEIRRDTVTHEVLDVRPARPASEPVAPDFAQAAKSTVPTQPAEPSTPAEMTRPAESSTPAESSMPAETTQPAEATKPADPA